MLIRSKSAAGSDAGREYLEQQRSSWGYLPNYAAIFETRPDIGQAWNALNAAIRDHMDRRRYEVATLAAAQALRSTYCTAAHAKFLRDVCEDEDTMLAIAADPSGLSLDDVDRAIVTFARKVVRDAAGITAVDVRALHDVGLSDQEIGDVVYAAAARCFFAKVLDGFGAQADEELGAAFDAEVRDQLTVGRPIANAAEG